VREYYADIFNVHGCGNIFSRRAFLLEISLRLNERRDGISETVAAKPAHRARRKKDALRSTSKFAQLTLPALRITQRASMIAKIVAVGFQPSPGFLAVVSGTLSSRCFKQH
jgi:hypothetical protein